jgi:hypothetical protein
MSRFDTCPASDQGPDVEYRYEGGVQDEDLRYAIQSALDGLLTWEGVADQAEDGAYHEIAKLARCISYMEQQLLTLHGLVRNRYIGQPIPHGPAANTCQLVCLSVDLAVAGCVPAPQELTLWSCDAGASSTTCAGGRPLSERQIADLSHYVCRYHDLMESSGSLGSWLMYASLFVYMASRSLTQQEVAGWLYAAELASKREMTTVLVLCEVRDSIYVDY